MSLRGERGQRQEAGGWSHENRTFIYPCPRHTGTREGRPQGAGSEPEDVFPCSAMEKTLLRGSCEGAVLQESDPCPEPGEIDCLPRFQNCSSLLSDHLRTPPSPELLNMFE